MWNRGKFRTNEIKIVWCLQESSCQTLDSNNTGSTIISRSKLEGRIRTRTVTGTQRSGKEVMTQDKGTTSRQSQGGSESRDKGTKQLISEIREETVCNGKTGSPRISRKLKGMGICNG